MPVRPATLQDLEPLTHLFDAYRLFYHQPSDFSAASIFLRERLAQKDSVIFVAEEDGTLTGFTQLYPLFSSTRMMRLWLLNDLFVVPEHRGRGISLGLIDAAKTHCRETGAAGLLLQTAKTNTIGNSLYPRAGFILDEGHNYYTWSPE